MLKDMAIRLWAVSSLLRSTDNTAVLNDCGEICDDIAMALAKLAGTDYDQCREAADKEALNPTYKFSNQG